MATRTTTEVTHYHVQKERRAEFLEEWRQPRHRRRARRREMHETARGMRRGVYVGADGDRPTRTMDALVHEVDPGAVTTVHRHSWDAMVFVVAGWGWTEIDGQRIDWGPGDSLHLPAWAWHRHGNEGSETARYLTFSCEPMLETMGMAFIEDGGHTPVARAAAAPAVSPGPIDGDDPYAGAAPPAGRDQEARRSGRLHTSWDDLELLNTPRGTRTTFLLDRAIGYQASGITMAMFEIGPGPRAVDAPAPRRGLALRASRAGATPTSAPSRRAGRPTRGRRATSSSSTISCGTSTSTTTPRRRRRSCASTCSTACWRRCGRSATRWCSSRSRRTHIRDKQAGDPDDRLAGADTGPRGRDSRPHVRRAAPGRGRRCTRCRPTTTTGRGTRRRPARRQGAAARHGAADDAARQAARRAPGSADGLIVLAGPPGTGKTTLGRGARPGGGAGGRRRGARPRSSRSTRTPCPARCSGRASARHPAHAGRAPRARRATPPHRRAHRRGRELRGAAVGRVVRHQPGRRAARDGRGAGGPGHLASSSARGCRRHDDQLPGRPSTRRSCRGPTWCCTCRCRTRRPSPRSCVPRCVSWPGSGRRSGRSLRTRRCWASSRRGAPAGTADGCASSCSPRSPSASTSLSIPRCLPRQTCSPRPTSPGPARRCPRRPEPGFRKATFRPGSRSDRQGRPGEPELVSPEMSVLHDIVRFEHAFGFGGV